MLRALVLLLVYPRASAIVEQLENLGSDADDANGSLTFVFENDAAAGLDQHYTNGLLLSWTSGEDRGPIFMRRLAETLLASDGHNRASFALGQSMFTPRDIRTAHADPNDRPYAGWLYGSASISRRARSFTQSARLTIGLVGPAAFASQTQTLVHRWVGSVPRGWGAQLRDEPGINLEYTIAVRAAAIRIGPVSCDLMPHAYVLAGSPYTMADMGAVVRLGTNLGISAPPRVAPAPTIDDSFEIGRPVAWYVFAGGDMRGVARNTFLDGNIFAHGPRVDKEPMVFDFVTGAVVVVRSFRVSMTGVVRSHEFTTQQSTDAYASLALSKRL